MNEDELRILKHIAIAHKEDEETNKNLVNVNTGRFLKNRELAQAIEKLLELLEV